MADLEGFPMMTQLTAVARMPLLFAGRRSKQNFGPQRQSKGASALQWRPKVLLPCTEGKKGYLTRTSYGRTTGTATAVWFTEPFLRRVLGMVSGSLHSAVWVLPAALPWQALLKLNVEYLRHLQPDLEAFFKQKPGWTLPVLTPKRSSFPVSGLETNIQPHQDGPIQQTPIISLIEGKRLGILGGQRGLSRLDRLKPPSALREVPLHLRNGREWSKAVAAVPPWDCAVMPPFEGYRFALLDNTEVGHWASPIDLVHPETGALLRLGRPSGNTAIWESANDIWAWKQQFKPVRRLDRSILRASDGTS